MLESTRLAYLEAMGVVGWVPRQPLANAAWRLPPLMPEWEDEPDAHTQAPAPPPPEQRVAIRPAPQSTGNNAGSALEQTRARIAGADTPRQQAQPAPAAEAPAPSREEPVKAEPLESFYLQLWQAGSCAL